MQSSVTTVDAYLAEAPSDRLDQREVDRVGLALIERRDHGNAGGC